MILHDLTITAVTEPFVLEKSLGQSDTITNRGTYGISLCDSGEIFYYQDGKKYIENTGNAVLLPKGQSYRLQTQKAGSFYVINFESAETITEKIHSLPLHNMGACIAALQKIKNDCLYKKPKAELLKDFYELICKMIAGNDPRPSLSPAMDFINRNYHLPALSNEMIAKQCGVSEVYMRKLFHERYGLSPKQFIIHLRIAKAKELLLEKRYSVLAISEACGFTNPYHFCRLFKEKTGYSPSQYIKMIGEPTL